MTMLNSMLGNSGLGSGGGGSEDNWVTEIPSGTVNGINTVFTISNTPIEDSHELSLNGMSLSIPDDYSLSGTTITFVAPPQPSDRILIRYEIV